MDPTSLNAFSDEIAKIAAMSPLNRQLLASRILGGSLGAAAGAGVGYGASEAFSPLPEGDIPDSTKRNVIGATTGAILGAAGGSALGGRLKLTQLRNKLKAAETGIEGKLKETAKGINPASFEGMSAPPVDISQKPIPLQKVKINGKTVFKGKVTPTEAAVRKYQNPGTRVELGLPGEAPWDSPEFFFKTSEARLQKKAEVTREEAERALKRLEDLKARKVDKAQAARYAGIGAAVGTGASVLRNVIGGTKGRHWSGAAQGAIQAYGKPMATARSLTSAAVGGGITSGAIPILRHQADLEAEKRILQDFVGQHQSKLMPKTAGIGVGAPMTKSQYSGPLSYGRFPMASRSPQFVAPDPRNAPFAEGHPEGIAEEGIKVGFRVPPTSVGSPRSQLSNAMRVGRPRISPPSGPSIQQVSKPTGFGRPIAGAKKTHI